MSPKPDLWKDFACTTTDGLTIRGRDYGTRSSALAPVVYLPGLTRTIRDFEQTALLLSQDPLAPRRVLSIDYRGRGSSDHDTNWKNYTPLTEASDVLNAMIAADIHKAVMFGTSRGGIISMLLGAIKPTILGGVVLHDIGPIIDVRGLLRIKSYLTQMPIAKNWNEAADILRSVHEGSFPNFERGDWQKAARLTFADNDGTPFTDYDPALLKTLKNISSDTIAPNLWPEFKALRNIPTLTIRGDLSDVLSKQTLDQMAQAHPTMRTVIIPQQGHVPLLDGADTIDAMRTFLQSVDGMR